MSILRAPRGRILSDYDRVGDHHRPPGQRRIVERVRDGAPLETLDTLGAVIEAPRRGTRAVPTVSANYARVPLQALGPLGVGGGPMGSRSCLYTSCTGWRHSRGSRPGSGGSAALFAVHAKHLPDTLSHAVVAPPQSASLWHPVRPDPPPPDELREATTMPTTMMITTMMIPIMSPDMLGGAACPSEGPRREVYTAREKLRPGARSWRLTRTRCSRTCGPPRTARSRCPGRRSGSPAGAGRTFPGSPGPAS